MIDFFRKTSDQELVALAEQLAAANGHLQIELGKVRAELSALRQSKKLIDMRGDRRMVERAVADAKWLSVLHLASLNTSRRADTHGLGRHRHESAIGILRLGGVYGLRGWTSTDPATVHQGIERGRSAAIANPERWRYRMAKHRYLHG